MEEPISKSQKKRDAEALTKLGSELVELKVALLDMLPLPEALYKAILDAKQIKSFGAKKRQSLLIGKLMRAVDAELITEAYNNLVADNSAQTADFHALEIWRDRLMQADNMALTEFITEYQPRDIQFLRQLIKKAIEEKTRGKNIGASKALFRYLRSCVS
jgi:ribosome-associated protein